MMIKLDESKSHITVENQRTITEWADTTFGQPTPVVACRMMCEMSELLCGTYIYSWAFHSDERIKHIHYECADVGIMLLQLCEKCGAYGSDRGLRFDSAHLHDRDSVLSKLLRLNTMLAKLVTDITTRSMVWLKTAQLANQCMEALEELYQFASMVGVRDLMWLIADKMQVNRSRQWSKDFNGFWQHI
jgi:hypothetical protein